MLSYYRSGATRSLAFRTAQLKKLREALKTYETEIAEALYTDLKKVRKRHMEPKPDWYMPS